jgi:hypothetical protein
MPYGHLLRDIADEANKRDALLVALAAAYVPFRNVPRDGLPSPMVALLAAVQAAIANAPPLAATGAPAAVPPSPVPPSPVPRSSIKPNMFAAACCHCGAAVPKGAGTIGKNDHGSWAAVCAPCAAGRIGQIAVASALTF